MPQEVTDKDHLRLNELNRLTQITDSGYMRSFDYDAWGNLAVTGAQGLTPSPLMPSTTSVNPATNRLGAAGYDAAGNQTSVGAGIALTYDAENRQKSSGDAASQLGVTYVYDPEGRRVMKQRSDGTQQVYVYDAFGLLAAEYQTNTVSAPACRTCYLTYDHLGSLRVVTDQNRQVI